MAGTTENTGDSVPSTGSTSTAASSFPAASTPMTAVAALEKASGALSSSAAAPGQTKPGDTTAAGGTGTPPAAPATTQQAQPSGQPDATGARAPIPLDRHEAAVKNARVAGQTEALKSITGADVITPQHQADVKLGYTLVGDLRQNPKAFIENVARDLGLQVVPIGQAADTPAAGGMKPGQMPSGDLRSEDGKLAYSADLTMQLIDMKVKEAMERIQGTVQPLLTAHEVQQQEAEKAQRREAAREQSTEFLTEMRQRDHFKDYEPAILERFRAMSPEEKARRGGPFAALQVAYLDVLNEIVKPKLAADADQKVRDEYTKKANTAGGIVPNGSQPTGATKRPSNVRELSKHLERALG